MLDITEPDHQLDEIIISDSESDNDTENENAYASLMYDSFESNSDSDYDITEMDDSTSNIDGRIDMDSDSTNMSSTNDGLVSETNEYYKKLFHIQESYVDVERINCARIRKENDENFNKELQEERKINR